MNLQSEEDNINFFKCEQKRLETFSSWPYSSPMKPGDLAKAGFFYTGRDDLVQCVFCKQILGQWSPEDIPINEHIKFSPQCPFVNYPLNVGNIPIVAVYTFPHFTIPIQETQGGEQSQFNQDSLSDRPIHFKYSSYESRLQSFVTSTYPQNKAQTPRQLAEAGFFYTGEADNVKCFFCDGGLRSWDPVDNPWTEHARWFPKCTFLRLSRGEEFIKEVIDRFEQEATGGSPSSDFSVVLQQSPPAQIALRSGIPHETVENTVRQHIQRHGRPPISEAEFQEALNTLQNMTLINKQQNFNRHSVQNDEMEIPEEGTETQNKDKTEKSETNKTEKSETNNDSKINQKDLEKTIQDLEEERICKICMDEKANVVFLECGHLVCCEECATQVRNCPICRKIIVKLVKTYMS